MEYWLVSIVSIIIGMLVALYNVLMAFPIILIGLTFGLILIILKKWR